MLNSPFIGRCSVKGIHSHQLIDNRPRHFYGDRAHTRGVSASRHYIEIINESLTFVGMIDLLFRDESNIGIL